MSKRDVEEIFEAFKNLSPGDQLRVAAGMLDERKPDTAKLMIDHVGTQLGAALAIRDMNARKAAGK